MLKQDNNIDQNSEFKRRVIDVVKEYQRNGSFIERKLTDTPTDSLSMVNRRFVTLNGTTGNRPTSPILGQFYFDTDDGFPVWWNGSTWVDSTGGPA